MALEQIPPGAVAELAALADQNGFAGTVVADRFQPWLPSQGNASFAWTMLGAIGQQTKGMLTASAVPGYRMHPAAVAQASATLAALYPDRHRLVLSAGDAIDEHVVGQYWPEAPERAAKLFDAVEVIRKLFSSSARGNDTRHSGTHFKLESSRLWTMPDKPPLVQVWAGGPVTARRAGRTVDGIVVQAGPAERLTALINAFREGRRESGRSPAATQVAVHVQVSWAPSDDEAMAQALKDWPMAGLRFPRGDIRSPFDVDQLVRSVSAEDIRARILVSSDPDVHRRYLQSFFDLGFDAVHVHNVGLGTQREWIEMAGREILPELVGRRG